jgi:hypothetical protein
VYSDGFAPQVLADEQTDYLLSEILRKVRDETYNRDARRVGGSERDLPMLECKRAETPVDPEARSKCRL